VKCYTPKFIEIQSSKLSKIIILHLNSIPNAIQMISVTNHKL
jgi:hypothetical protein